ncbi:MAG: EamA family transporter [Actinobacteria bacterium]|nr:EamA family transporter [Actinomycetota bacterium]
MRHLDLPERDGDDREAGERSEHLRLGERDRVEARRVTLHQDDLHGIGGGAEENEEVAERIAGADSGEQCEPDDRERDANPNRPADARPEEDEGEQRREDDVKPGDEAGARDGRALEAGRLQRVPERQQEAKSGAGDPLGDLLVLLGSAAYSVQIVLMERYAPRYDPVALTQAEMLAAFAGFAVVAVALRQVEVPHGWTVWGALLVTGVFASALGFLVQTWAQRRTSATRTALAFAMEPVWAGFFGFWLAGDRLGAIGWAGCAVIMAGILVAEPEAGRTLRRLVARA